MQSSIKFLIMLCRVIKPTLVYPINGLNDFENYYNGILTTFDFFTISYYAKYKLTVQYQ